MNNLLKGFVVILLIALATFLYFNQTSNQALINWKTYLDSEFNFEIDYPEDWSVSESIISNSADVQKILTISKSGYNVVLYISKKVDTRKESSSLQISNIGIIGNQQLVRDTKPRMEDQKGISYYFVILSKIPEGYSRSIRNGIYNYSIYYYLPLETYDEAMVSGADSIVSTLRFK